MDEFRVGSLSQTDPYRDQETHDSLGRKKNRRPRVHATEGDEVALSSDQEEQTGGESFADFYAPAETPDEPEK